MFTGLIEAVCTVASARQSAGTMQLRVDLGALAEGVGTGDSIAINGVCLTVTNIEGTKAVFDVSGETLTVSTLGRLTASAPVNIEKALRPTDRLGGHIVQGHIDGIASIKAVNKSGQFAEFNFETESGLLEMMVPKGSVAVDGISLTIAKLDRNGFSVTVIPETLQRTTLAGAKVGDKVNVEIDMIAKMIKKQLDNILPRRQGLTIDKLQQLGF